MTKNAEVNAHRVTSVVVLLKQKWRQPLLQRRQSSQWSLPGHCMQR
jgi:hypothetical protein